MLRHDPIWYKDAIIYELHVRAFKDSNGDGNGDFKGLMSKLDYLQDLGITALWLLPFYPSPLRDGGYDISDYRGVNPEYGTLKDFKLFVKEAHRRGIRVITELVINHTSDQHPWFQAARRAKPGSIRRNFYVWSDTPEKFPETRIIFSDTERSNWAWDTEAEAYYWHRFFSHQPDLNHNNHRVVQAIIKVLRFWLDMGVDGLRLDAVPYLCVQEGTNNENLPETHQVIKRMRKEIDANYDDRMLLAEANQWPEDVRAYFGDGDECHMAFHFPLMPRIFMAIRKEDRHPITEIIARTPEIPSNCQWGLFLRNHDELTLEMVTDEERDYMYSEYVTDPRMRVNVGIRRRLAPLVDNDTRTIQMLNSLLFSFPGTPIIYYGDEIGMGDNIYLGDRDGVRTPMQWSIDRNAGFSTTDPARLYHPIIMDPVYGYQAVNVEAQERNPSSLLNFMKRMISLRRRYKAFGRGSITFLHPKNRKILAYIRRYKRETILCVVNLSKTVQPVELDLSDYKELIPMEMMGRTEFPPIGELPYFLTLGPHAFYWFMLERQGVPITQGKAPSMEEISFPTLILEHGLDNLWDPDNRQILEGEILPDYIPKQHWYIKSPVQITGTRIVDWSKIGVNFYLTFVETMFDDESSLTYCLPLRVTTGKGANTIMETVPQSIMARIRFHNSEGVLYDALFDEIACNMLYSSMDDSRHYVSHQKGQIFAFSDPDGIKQHKERETDRGFPVRPITPEQKNTSVIYDESMMLKFFRRMEHGPNPDMEIRHYLSENTTFRHFPRVIGGVEYHPANQHLSSTVAMLQEFIINSGNARTLSRQYIQSFVKTRNGSNPKATDHQDLLHPFLHGVTNIKLPESLEDNLEESLTFARLLGQRTSDLHLALGQPTRDNDFSPKPFKDSDMEFMFESFTRQAQKSLSQLNTDIDSLAPLDQDLANNALAASTTIIDHYQQLTESVPEAMKIRCHGNYTLANVVVSEKQDLIVVDFEGDLRYPLSVRRKKQSPLQDIASMLYAIQDVAYYTQLDAEAESGPSDKTTEALYDQWQIGVSLVFLRAYLDGVADAPFIPKQQAHLELLLSSFMLNHAFELLDEHLATRSPCVRIALKTINGLLKKPVLIER